MSAWIIFNHPLLYESVAYNLLHSFSFFLQPTTRFSILLINPLVVVFCIILFLSLWLLFLYTSWSASWEPVFYSWSSCNMRKWFLFHYSKRRASFLTVSEPKVIFHSGPNLQKLVLQSPQIIKWWQTISLHSDLPPINHFCITFSAVCLSVSSPLIGAMISQHAAVSTMRSVQESPPCDGKGSTHTAEQRF